MTVDLAHWYLNGVTAAAHAIAALLGAAAVVLAFSITMIAIGTALTPLARRANAHHQARQAWRTHHNSGRR